MSREELEQTIRDALYGIAIRPGPSVLEMAAQGHPIRLSGNERDEGVRLVLDAIKEAGGKVLLPTDPKSARYGMRLYVGAYRRRDGLDSMLLIDREEDCITTVYRNVLDEQS